MKRDWNCLTECPALAEQHGPGLPPCTVQSKGTIDPKCPYTHPTRRYVVPSREHQVEAILAFRESLEA